MPFDPLLLLSIMFFQIGNRYLKINLTKAQEKLLMHPYTQIGLYFMIVYYSTRDLKMTIFIVLLSSLFFFILFNEQSKYHILSEEWLQKENIKTDENNEKEVINMTESYKNNLHVIHQTHL